MLRVPRPLAALFFLVAVVLVWPLAALAQEAALPPPTLAERFMVTVVFPAAALIITTIIGVAGTFLTGWIRAKYKGTKYEAEANAAADKMDRGLALIDHAIAEVDRKTKATQQEIAADGRISPEEAQRLQQEAFEAAKLFLGEQGLRELAGLFGVDTANPTAVVTWLRGAIETRFFGKKMAEDAIRKAAPPVVISNVVDQLPKGTTVTPPTGVDLSFR